LIGSATNEWLKTGAAELKNLIKEVLHRHDFDSDVRTSLTATAPVQAAACMSDDNDAVPLFDGMHRAAPVKAATGMSDDDDDDVPVIRWNASNYLS
jgi:hypothetical protein